MLTRQVLPHPSAQLAACKPVRAQVASRPSLAHCRSCKVVCSSNADQEASIAQRFAVPAAALLGAALLFVATPDEAMAARSGGRVGGSGFSSRRAPAPRAAAPRAGPSGGNRTYNTYVAPPIISPFGYGMGYGYGGGVGIMPFPMFGLGSLFNVVLIMFVLNIVLSTISNFTNGSKDSSKDSIDEDEKW